MLVISKETLIIIGVLLAVGILGLVLVLTAPRSEGVAAGPSVPSAAQTVAATAPAPAATVKPTLPPVQAAPATTQAPSATAVQAPAATTSLAPVVEPPETPPVLAGPVAAAVDGVIREGEYAHSTEAGGFQIHWSNDASFLRVGLISPGTGYLAIGFDPDDRMQGANFVLAAVRNGQLWTRDDYGNGPLTHASDTSLGGTDDILAAAGREDEGKTYVEFVMALNSGDRMDKVLVPGTTYDIVIAFHETNDDFDTYHSRRGAGKMRLDPG
ncbi:MAG: DOMON domain-containing protein [Thermotogota bacterium]